MAFEKALSVGFDSNEIAGFSLNLKQSSVSRVQSNYQVADQTENLQNRRTTVLSEFVKILEDARIKAKIFIEGTDFIVDLAEKLTDQVKEQQNKLRETLFPLLEALENIED